MMDDRPPEVQIPEPASPSSSRSERSSSIPPEPPLQPNPIQLPPARLAPAPVARSRGVMLGMLVVTGVTVGIVVLIAVFEPGSGSRKSTSTYSGSGSSGGGGGRVPTAISAQAAANEQNILSELNKAAPGIAAALREADRNQNLRSQFDGSQALNVSQSRTPPETKTFRVSSTVSAELDREKRAIDDEKAKAARIEAVLEESNTAVEVKKAELDELDTNLETLSRQIDRERIYMDRTSQYDIDSFNLKVNRYNSALRNRKAEAEVFNDMVDTHNTLVRQLKTQNQRVNQMVENYNSKLSQYGRQK